MRPYDRIGRYGGEEFLVVLPNSDLEQTRQQAERMRVILEHRPMYVDGQELQVTASFGATVSDGSDRLPDQYVRVADEALYRAKNGGRNQVAWLLADEPDLSHSLQRISDSLGAAGKRHAPEPVTQG
jgi:diguanylate cyclase (GGDEF)-like protein